MFGTLKPRSLACGGVRERYRHYYCGLCQTLGSDYDQLSRGMLSFDAVFVALVADGLLEKGGTPGRVRCPLLPVIHQPTLGGSETAQQFAAAVQLLLGDQWLADRADGVGLKPRLAGWGRGLLSGRVEAARASLSRLGADLSGLDGVELRQTETERQGDWEHADRPTAEALGLVFGALAELPGGDGLGGHVEELRGFGSALGSIIYWVDALEDLRRDLLAGEWNPCLRAGALVPGRVERVIDRLDAALAALARHQAALPWKRNRVLVEGIAVQELGRQADRARRQARSVLSGEGQRLIALARQLSGWERALAALMMIWFQLQVTLRPAIAFAQQATASPSPVPSPKATPLPSPGPPPVAIDGCGPCNRLVEACIEGTFGCCFGSEGNEGCIGASGGCCSQSCGSCGEACQDCGDLGPCCQPCGECGQVCNSCGECGDCCQNCDGCQGCQNCGNGCNGCNNCNC